MKWPVRLLRVAYVCLIASLPIYAVAANYSATSGSGLTFGSIVVSAVNYAQQLVCDPTTPSQCAAVSAGGAVKVDNSAVTQPVSGTITANAGTNLNTSALATSANQATEISSLSTIASNTGAAIPTQASTVSIGGVGIAQDSTSTSAGTTAVAGTSASSVVAKASAGNLQNAYVNSSAAGWVFIINATSLPSNATLTIGTASGNLQGCFELQKGVTDWGASINYNPGPWEHFSAGIVVAISSTDCPVLTAATTGKFIHSQAN
jgi:hypothetical protein